jgi:RES domain-containing protein
MLVYRVGKEIYSRDLNGMGAKLYGGRWNNVGIACIYTSQSRALALLEYSVNVENNLMPASLCFTTIEIQDDLIEEIPINNLPHNWKSIPTSSTSKIFGTEKLAQSSFPILRFPSVIIPSEFNYILNVNRLNELNPKIISVEKYDFDHRIKR